MIALPEPPAIVAPEVRQRPAAGMRRAMATWYGPGFYGGTFACGGTYYANTRGVAHMTLPCGTVVLLQRGARRVRVRVVDRGAFASGNFDLTARVAMDLCSCTRPYTMQVQWRVVK